MAENAFLTLMPSTITVRTRTGHNNHGEPTFSTTAVSYRARWVGRSGAVRGRDGETYEIRSMLWVHSTGVINKTDRITLPDGTTPEIIAVDRFPDQVGTHHYRITMGH